MRVKRSTGNVFRDVGFPPAEAENLRVRAQLMVEIEKYVRSKGLTQKAAAKQFGVTQPRISDLTRGKIGLFSVDTLISMLTHAGLKVDVKVRRSAA
jgi:predicted XRE-type DNA-binding protein